jgi:hypothetical protein
MPLRALALAVALLGLFLLAGQAQAPDAARRTAARELMEAAGVAGTFEQVMPSLVQHLSESFVAVAPDKAKEIREVFSRLTVKFIDRKSELIDQIAELYAARLSAEDLAAAVAFYRSAAGARFVAAQPVVMRASMVLGQRWGERIGREIEAEARKELKRRGIDL